jgi:hypothetical protein
MMLRVSQSGVQSRGLVVLTFGLAAGVIVDAGNLGRGVLTGEFVLQVETVEMNGRSSDG